MTFRVRVDLGERGYPIFVGPDLLARPDLFQPCLHGRQVLVVTDETVAPLYLSRVLAAVDGFEARSLVLPAGEDAKRWEVLENVFDALLAAKFNRRATLVALGGGVVGDMTGFAAACYQRGVSHVQVPTTLLAQVDSSIGGKTGINHPSGKNMIGAFHQPVCVIADTTTLGTLSRRDLRAGFAEIVKYGVLGDAAFFAWLEENVDALVELETDALTRAVRRSCELKSAIVVADEREAGRRALLNLGHTFGHAIETGLGYGRWRHGEAVAAGICVAADLSARLGLIGPGDVRRIERLLGRARLPTRIPAALTPERILELMAVDKKVIDDGMRLVLLRAVGDAFITRRFSTSALRETLDACHETG